VSGEYCIGFVPWETLQRPALLEAPIPAVSGVSPLVYVGFGFGETSEAGQPYHGWLFAYNTSLQQQFAFATTTAGPASIGGTNNPNWPACNFNCSCTGSTCTTTTGPVATSCIAGNGTQSYQSSYNFCGHAAGMWMSGRGGAAATDAENVSHAYFGIGNGSFQQNLTNSSGALLTPSQTGARAWWISRYRRPLSAKLPLNTSRHIAIQFKANCWGRRPTSIRYRILSRG